ncbi:hypothetical protein DPMN_095502 [Dreissena polymorpha]|uniref:Uncharacterized protein n=1 Tax=Dreissena polymorpha TaxID=45954 RepID=A0A9D4L6M0_DREPO|nr:hypothetical protein DPMN_095502 [Dreissena polymorpha]
MARELRDADNFSDVIKETRRLCSPLIRAFAYGVGGQRFETYKVNLKTWPFAMPAAC